MTTAAPVRPLTVISAGVVSSAGYGLAPLADLLNGEAGPGGGAGPGAGDYPPRPVQPVPGFDLAEHLGRKGIKYLDRLTGLSLVACKQALEAAGPGVTGEELTRTGVVLATNTGSIAGYTDLLYDTLTLDKPQLINPGKFSNSVMNCSAGQMAIRHGLKGLNATVAAWPQRQSLRLPARPDGHVGGPCRPAAGGRCRGAQRSDGLGVAPRRDAARAGAGR